MPNIRLAIAMPQRHLMTDVDVLGQTCLWVRHVCGSDMCSVRRVWVPPFRTVLFLDNSKTARSQESAQYIHSVSHTCPWVIMV
jgi:hypothetical protein